MSDIKIIVAADVTQATNGLRAVQGELGKTASIAKTSTTAFAGIGSSISSLGSTLISGGILTGVALLGTGLYELAKDAYALSDAQIRLNDVLDGAKNAYVKATIEVQKMKDVFEQARTGVISKEKALSVYNNTIGKTIGQTNDLDIAEKNFIKNADNYIKYTLLKAAANIALGKAAEQAFKIEQERIQGPTKEGRFLAELTASRFGSRSDEERQQDRINAALKQENLYKDIANSLQQQANAFGFVGVEQAEKELKVTEKIVKAHKEKVEIVKDPRIYNFLKKDITAESLRTPLEPVIFIKPQFKFLESSNFTKENKEALERTIDTYRTTAVNAFASVGDAIQSSLEGRGNIFGNLFGGLLKALGAGLKELGIKTIAASEAIAAAKAALRIGSISGIGAGLALVALGALISAAASKVQGVQGFASGVRGFSGGTALVGERGPERIFLPAGSSVQPNNELNAFGGGQMVFIPDVRLQGTDLVIAFNRASQAMSRNN